MQTARNPVNQTATSELFHLAQCMARRLHRYATIVAAAFFVSLLVACGGGGGGGGGNATAGSGNVGSTGGAVASSDGVVQMEIPAGALLGSTTFSLTPIDTIANLPADVTLLPGSAYHIAWTGAGFTQDGAATVRFRNSDGKQVVAKEIPTGPQGLVLMCSNGAYAYVMPEQVAMYLKFNYVLGACPAQGADVGRVSGNAPVITQQPASITVQQSQQANFSVAASGSNPLSYQWRRNGTNIAGATHSSYVISSASIADSGAVFSVVVSNVFGSTTSSGATLVVSATLPTSAPWIVASNGGYTDLVANGIAADKTDGSIYITGSTAGAVGNNTNQGQDDAFLAKLDSFGVLIWGVQIGTTKMDSGRSVAVDSAQNVYVAGYTGGSLNGTTHIGAVGDSDVFIAKYNKDGVHQWTKLLGTAAADYASAIAIDSGNNIYVTGTTQGTLDPAELPASNAGADHVFVARYNTDGVLQWVKQLWTLNIDATPASSSGTSITTDSSGGSVYVAGWTNGLIAGTTSNGGDDAFLAKYNAAGTRQWTQQFGTTYSDRAYGVACDSAGNVYTSGTVPSGNSFDENGFLSKHDPSGAFQWTRQIGSSTVEERGIGVVVDGSDGIYIAGDVFVFGSGGSLNTVPITANGEIFVIKYDTSGALKGTQLWTSSNSALMPFNTGVALSPDGGILVSGYTHNTSSGPNYSIMHKFTWP